ncbi:MAG: helix-turn-helix transcriptional regulator [Clostridia bacterium]|nr:helix-turn-helix transcriptional regulator [Clostridia bacterium]
MNLFVVRLKELLAGSGKMQKEICADMNISKQKLSKWKTGYNEPSLDELIMIAHYFDVSTDYLLGIDDDINYKRV